MEPIYRWGVLVWKLLTLLIQDNLFCDELPKKGLCYSNANFDSEGMPSDLKRVGEKKGDHKGVHALS